MPVRPCLKCRRLTDNGSWCPEHEPPPWRQRSPSSRATARPGWNRLRKMALIRDRHRCVRCGGAEGLEVHHRVPVAEGGPNTLDNLETVCDRCHGDAHREGA